VDIEMDTDADMDTDIEIKINTFEINFVQWYSISDCPNNGIVS
jgi:hypothetical protein